MTEWTGYSIAAVVLAIIAIIMIIAGIVWYEVYGTGTLTTWMWVLIIGGVILLIMAIVIGFIGRGSSQKSYYSSMTHTGLPDVGMNGGIHPAVHMAAVDNAYETGVAHGASGMSVGMAGSQYYPSLPATMN